MKKIIVVIGLGRFGIGLVNAFADKDVDVIAIDRDKNNVAKIGYLIDNAVCCDSTDADALLEAGVGEADNAIIAFGQDTQANLATTILTAVALKKIGVKKITCRIDDAVYEELLIKLGVDSVISPFDIASESLAMRMSSNNVMDYYKVADGYNVYELNIPKTVKPISLIDLAAPSRFGVNIILVSRQNKTFLPNKDYEINPSDHIFIFGKEKGVYQLETFLADGE
ncbi:MAG: TrkA family potassium uptake protein [Bacilli bacterium]|jgi:trk system potassium uptake protein